MKEGKPLQQPPQTHRDLSQRKLVKTHSTTQTTKAKAAKDLRQVLVGKGDKTRYPHTPFYRGGLRLRGGCDSQDTTAISEGKENPNGYLREFLHLLTALCASFDTQSAEENPTSGYMRKMRRAWSEGKSQNG